MFLATLALERKDISIGFLFGLCIGFFNFDLMCRQNRRLLQGPQKGSDRRAAFSFLLRYAIISAAGVAVWWKQLHPITALAGFFVVSLVLITHEFIESLKRRFLSVEEHS